MIHGAHRELARLAVGFVVFFLATACFGQAPGAASGLAWLQQQVAVDGTVVGEGASIATPFQVRAEVLTTLSLLGTTPPALVQKLQSETDATYEPLARRIVSLKAAGANVAGLGSSLVAGASPAGGWGFAAGHPANSLDSAFALGALQAAGLGGDAAVASAIAFVAANQIPGAGWGFNEQSSLYVTAHVLAALKAYAASQFVDAPVASARTWLLAQRTAGRYASVFENATAFLALSTTDNDPALLQPIVDAIAAAQGANGSWSGDTYLTALALRALGTWTGSFGQVRGRVVAAGSGTAIAGATVTLVAFGNITATTDAQGNFTLANVRPGTHPLSITASGFGTFTTQVGVRSGQTLDLGTLSLGADTPTGAVIRGVITDAVTSQPVGNAVVTVTIAGQSTTSVSDPSGGYSVSGLAAGAASVSVQRNGYRTLTTTRTVEAGKVYTFAVRLYPTTVSGAQLDGVVVDQSTGETIAGVTVALGGPNTQSTTTDSLGRFGLTGLAAGTSSITLTAAGYATLAGSVTLVSNQTLYVTLPMQPVTPGTTPRDLPGRVIDNVTRLPIEGVTIGAFHGGAGFTFFSGADGRFTITAYRGGLLQVSLAKPGYENAFYTFDPAQGPVVNLGDLPMLPENIGGSLPDLAIGNLDRTAVAESSVGAASGTLAVSVKNQGATDIAATKSFAVLAFVDVDGNGAYDAAVDIRLGEARVQGPLVRGASTTVAISLSGTVPFREAPIHAWVDSGNEIAEANDANNVRSTAEFCRLCPSNASVVPPGSGGLFIEPEFASSYQVSTLGPLPASVPVHYGFALPKKGDMCTVYFGGAANSTQGAMYSVRVVRDQNSRIIGFDGSQTTRVVSNMNHDGGAAYYGPQDHIFVSGFSTSSVFMIKQGDTVPGKTVGLTPLGIFRHSSLNVVPPGYPGAGKLKLTEWPGGEWHSATLQPDGNGYYNFDPIQHVTTSTIGGGPEGFIYVPKNSPGFPADSIVVAEYNNGMITTFEINANGDPKPQTRRIMLKALSNAEGAAIDPVTGDFIFSTYGGGDKVIAIRGFSKPLGLSDLTASRGRVVLDASGRVATITARVGNAGPETSPVTKLGFYAVRNGARAERLGELTVSTLARGAFADFTFALPSPTGLPGVTVVADDEALATECSEANNTVTVEVEPLLGLVAIRTAEAGYLPGSVVAITTTVTNPGESTKGYQVEVAISDANGVAVENLGRVAVNGVAGGASVDVPSSWTVPNLLAGTYRATATLFNADGAVIGTGLVTFQVFVAGSATPASSFVQTDRFSYSPTDTVLITARVTNERANAILENVRVRERVVGPGGGVVFTGEQTIEQLLPSTIRELTFVVAVSNASPGGYTVGQELFDAGGASLGVAMARFVVRSTADSGTGITATIAVTKLANAGDAVALTAQVRNQGNAAVTDLPVVLRIVKPDTGQVVAQWTAALTLSQSQELPVARTWDSTAASAGTYIATVSIVVNGNEMALAQDSMSLGAIVPFSFAPRTGVARNTVVTSDAATIAGLVTASPVSITGGEYRVNGAAWVSTPGTVVTGNTVEARQTSSTSFSTTTTARLLVGLFDAPFAVTTLDPDVTPEPIAFTPQLDVPLSSVRTSNTVAIAGIDVAVPISIAGGEYHVNGGAWTSASATVASGDQVTVRVTSASIPNATVTATLTVSSISAPFSVTTANAVPDDTTVDAFAFNARTGAPLNTLVVSNTVTLGGINVPVPIRVAGGEYSVNGAPFTAADGVVGNGDTVAVRLTSSGAYATTTSANLTVSQFSTGFTVTTAGIPAPSVAHAFARHARVLVLVSCRTPQGANDAACVQQRRAFLDGYLMTLGVEHIVVTDTDAFRAELRCGRWNAYWISGGAEKLKGTLAEEVREAVFRGDALVVDGVHDSRSAVLDEVLGVTYQATATQPTTVLLSGTILPSGSFTHAGGGLRVQLSGGSRQGSFGTSAGDTAIVTNTYGTGRAMQFAFDFTGTLLAQSGSTLLRSVAEQSLAWLTPAALTQYTGDALVPIVTTIQNPAAVAQEIEIVATLPAGVAFLAATPAPQSASATQVTWRLTLASGQAAAIEWSVRAPQATGTPTVQFTANRIEGGTATAVGSSSLAIPVTALDQATTQTVTALNALAITPTPERQARDRAVTAVLDAQAKVGQGLYGQAIAKYLTAGDELGLVTSVSVVVNQAAVDRLMLEASRRWCRAGSACAVGSATGSAYSLMVFGSASLSNGDSTGPVGVGGSASLNSYSVASALTGDPARLVVGGSVSWNNGSVGQGTGVIYAGGSASVGQSVGRRDLVSGVAVEDWNAIRTDQLARSDRLAAMTGTAATTAAGNAVNCTGTNAIWNVCSITAAQAQQARSINLTYPATSSVLVNITGGATNITNGQTTFNGQPLQGNPAAKQVIFNLAQIGGLVIDGWGWGGTLLAPRASVTHRNSAIDGQAVFNTLSSTGSFRCTGTFQAQLP